VTKEQPDLSYSITSYAAVTLVMIKETPISSKCPELEIKSGVGFNNRFETPFVPVDEGW
jgi:hypothetical protein